MYEGQVDPLEDDSDSVEETVGGRTQSSLWLRCCVFLALRATRGNVLCEIWRVDEEKVMVF